VAYRGKDRHNADMEGDGDACNKAFSNKCGFAQGVFNRGCQDKYPISWATVISIKTTIFDISLAQQLGILT